jgi:hypothetical protein
MVPKSSCHIQKMQGVLVVLLWSVRQLCTLRMAGGSESLGQAVGAVGSLSTCLPVPASFFELMSGISRRIWNRSSWAYHCSFTQTSVVRLFLL